MTWIMYHLMIGHVVIQIPVVSCVLIALQKTVIFVCYTNFTQIIDTYEFNDLNTRMAIIQILHVFN